MMDRRQFLEQHDRVKQLLLEGGHAPDLDEHVAACAVCSPLAGRLAEIEHLLRDVPQPRLELLHRLLGTGGEGEEARTATGRIEVLWPATPGARSARGSTALPPLVLVVDADRYPPETPRARHTERFVVVARYPIVIGRAPDADVPVWDRSASRRHAQIDWRGDGWVLRDLESTNGTRVNGARVSSTQVAWLRLGDLIEVGHHVRLTVRNLLPTLDPHGIAGEIRHLLAATGRGQERPSDELRARLAGLREETVQLRDQLSSIARQEADADALPQVYERLQNMLVLIDREVLR